MAIKSATGTKVPPKLLSAGAVAALLTIHTDPNYEFPDTQAGNLFEDQLEGNSLIMQDPEQENWSLTPRGQKFVDMLLDTPLPVSISTWHDPREPQP